MINQAAPERATALPWQTTVLTPYAILYRLPSNRTYMRFFIALETPEESRQQLKLVQQQLKAIIPQARLTDNGKLHLTIAFVGEQPEQMKDHLVELLKQASQDVPPFQVTPAYLDAFPKLHYPHTFWVGVKGDIDQLLLIRERIKDGLADLNLEVDERRYTPHIAIAKINHQFKLSHQQEVGLEKMMAGHFDPIRVTSIKLFESIPEHGFHTHNTLAEIPLV